MRPGRHPALLGASVFQLGLEAQTVIALRMMKFARGGDEAAVEAQRMITEKIDAALLANTLLAAGLMTGSVSGVHKAVTHYRRKVRANRRRLTNRRGRGRA